MFDKRINVFVGHFGSGKSEIAINCCLTLASEGKSAAIVDLDIVNPFFRTADMKEQLESLGVRVINPNYANTNSDAPSLSAEINTVFENETLQTVIDVGGDDIGANVLSTYRGYFKKDAYDVFLVVNTNRPYTKDVESIERMLDEIQQTSRLNVTWLINNTHMLEHSTEADLITGNRMIEFISKKRNIPIAFYAGMQSENVIVSKMMGIKYYKMSKHINLPWAK